MQGRKSYHASRITHHVSRSTHHASRITFHASRFTFHVSRFTLLFLLALLIIPSTSANAQTQPPSYWQYRASGRLQHALTADLDGDGIDNFIAVDENGRVAILDANGQLQHSYLAPGPVTAVHTTRTDSSPQSNQSIVLGLRNRLILLSATGATIWQTPLVSVATPPDLLTGGSQDSEAEWQEQYEAVPTAIDSLDWDGDDRNEILILLDSGQLQLFSADGSLIWRYVRNTNPDLKTEPHMRVIDLDQDGQTEVALGYFNPQLRFSHLALIGRNGRLLWDQEQPISGRITAMTDVLLDSQPAIAVGTSLGQVTLYNADRQRLLYRTVNKPVTAMTAVSLEDGPGFVIGTDAGSLIAYNWQGRRQWTRHLSPTASRPLLSLSAAAMTTPVNQPVLAAALGPPNEVEAQVETGGAKVVLLSRNGRTQETIEAIETTVPPQLTDINGDQHGELLLARFAILELHGIGISANEIASDWEYDLLASPRAMLVVDFDEDGEDELLVGTEDGRIHRLNNDGSVPWKLNPGATITHFAAIPNPDTGAPDVVVVRNNPLPQAGDDATGNNATGQSWLSLRQANGEQVWELALPAQITSLQVSDVNGRNQPQIIIGTNKGEVIAYTGGGSEQWRAALPESVRQLKTIPSRPPRLIAITPHRLYQINPHTVPWLLAYYPQPIQAIYPFSQANNEPDALLIFVADNHSYAITLLGRRLPQWPLTIDGPPTHSLFAQELPVENLLPQNTRQQNTSDYAFLITTGDGLLRQLVIEESRPRLSWLLTGLGDVTNLFWGDLDNDGVPNMAAGNANGRVDLYNVAANTRRPELTDRLELGSSVFALSILQREKSQKSDLLAITQNGVVQLFRVQENLPPLLTNPVVDAAQGGYSLIVSIQDVEQDDVTVRLEIFDPDAEQWLAQNEQQLNGGRGQLFWLLENPPADENGVRYRFHYDDGFHQGDVTPIPGPLPTPLPTLSRQPLTGFIVLALSGLIFVIFYLRQAQSPDAKVRRFYRELAQEPAQTLVKLENKYRHNGGSPDFLLSMANWARQQQDDHIASLVDGLFLLSNQPRAGLPIIISALDEAKRYAHPPWQCLNRWQQTFTLGQALLEAPSVTELSLLRPQLEQMLSLLDEADRWSPALTALLPILTNLRDSKRVDLANDSLVYLNEAAARLAEFWEEMPDETNVEQPVIEAIVERWSGLVGAEIEELRGRADLVVTLKTKRLISTDMTHVTLEIRNNGRAAAENIIAALAENAAYAGNGRPQHIPLLPPRQTAQVNFAIEPKVKDQFRLVLNLSYDDRNQRDKTLAFGDMVHLLPPMRHFKPIANPYLPGTPLRQDSAIFFGREDLFDFIAESAGRLMQRNVLILVGQRRTGKTSILLRLDQHLPADLLPVYIDCQSLGVTPGMPALLYDLAWTIADALALRGIDLDVPDTAVWQDDPTRYFQRQFLPQVKALLPEGTTILLVFDEFEAFENLVRDGILPPTLFPYLRHLMQHSNNLSFVFVGTRRLEEMSADYWSVLFNIALYQKIGYLSEEVAARLIQEPVAPNLVYDDLAIDKILRVTAGHPYFLQLVCYTLVKRANSKRRSYVTISNVNAGLDEMLSLGEMHFAYLWQRSSYGEKALLTAVSHMMDRESAFHPADLVQYLEPYGIHLPPAEVTAALKSLVERDILQEITEGTTALYELKIELVGLWVAKHKSLSHLYA